MSKYKTISRGQIIDRLDYDSDAGIFTWKMPHKKALRFKGKRAGCVWKAQANGNKDYRYIKFNCIPIAEHHLAWMIAYGEWPEMIDHKNGDSLDNRIDNLRICNPVINSQNHNRPTRSMTGFMGVKKIKSTGKYEASIGINGKSVYLGTYNTPQAAHESYLQARLSNHDCPSLKDGGKHAN